MYEVSKRAAVPVFCTDGPSRATRRYRTLGDDGAEYGDGVCYLYANATYRGDDEFGSLMADFCQSDPSKIVDGLLRERVQYLKGTGQGRIEMCRMSERIYNEGRERGARDRLVECVRSLMETMGLTAQTALEKLKVPEEDRPKYLAML